MVKWIQWLVLIGLNFPGWGQSEDCNQLGVWLWHIETTGFSHEVLAQNLKNRNIKRVYTKVADGQIDSTRWTELIDKNLVAAYLNEDVEPWAWSYNYLGNYDQQALALYYAAKTGYKGFVVDVEMEFDGLADELDQLFYAFDKAKQRAIEEQIIRPDDFKLYVTTWGNPKDHNYSIASIDPYVDGYMPQTYVEYWGPEYIENITFWIQEGNREYEELGATKPRHHIASTATGVMTATHINEFIAASGPETSLWRIPGAGVSFEVWEDWNAVDWNINFCDETSTKEPIPSDLQVYPNPTNGLLHLNFAGHKNIALFDLYGQMKLLIPHDTKVIDLSQLASGFYVLKVVGTGEMERIIKL